MPKGSSAVRPTNGLYLYLFSLACSLCLHNIASENDITFLQNVEYTADTYTLAVLSNTVVCSCLQFLPCHVIRVH